MRRRSGVSPNWHNKKSKRLEEVEGPDSSTSPALSDLALLTPATSDPELRLPSRTKAKAKTTRRAINTETEASSYEDGDKTDPSIGTRRRKVKVQRELLCVAAQGPPLPRSAYEGWEPAIEQVSESEAVHRLLKGCERKHAVDDTKPEWTYFHLSNFSVYRPASSYKHALELVSLDLLSQDRSPEFLFDGILSLDNERCFVQGVPFKILTVDGYGERDSTNLARQMCIQSPLAQHNDVWYSLGKPSVEYERFYKPFLWVARFGKHFLDYLLETSQVTLHHFRKRFYQWLHAQYEKDASFASWIAEASLTDFRTTVVAHFAFLYKECYSIDFDLCEHPIWREIDPNKLKAIAEQPNKEHRTIVTPYAYDCFHSMYFGDQMERRIINYNVMDKVWQRKKMLRLTPQFTGQHKATDALTPLSMGRHSPEPLSSVDTGDVICTRPNSDGKWTSTGDMWFAYVQQVRPFADRTLLDVLWLYEPVDTTIGKAAYPFKNELFMSDNCNCGKDALDLECAVEKVKIAWFANDPEAETGLFVRQKFRTIHEQDSYDFVALHQNDFACQCRDRIPLFEEYRSKYNVGDTVLVREWNHVLGEDRLQPAQIVSFDCAKMQVQLRKLLRKSESDPGPCIRPNELILTNDLFDKPASLIVRRCHVRFFTHKQVQAGDIVTPYDRDGSGDFWFVAGKDNIGQQKHQTELTFQNSDGELQYDDSLPCLPSLNEGWHPMSRPPRHKLTGMGIFCGGGTFDRGLEEGGGVTFRYAVDWASKALHSYRANVRRPETVQYFLGSVNDYLGRAMAGVKRGCIASVGKVNIISAGSPCPGFSALQNDKNSVESRRNASMVASVVSFVDLYVPEYLILENVVTMTNSMGPRKDENVFSQIVAALVGLGYQVQQFLMDAWSYGDPQLRSRVFIVASAPGLSPLSQPAHTHSEPRTIKVALNSLGKSSNGLAFGLRRQEYTPFEHVSAANAVADLPYIGDGQSQICVRYPDHRVPGTEPSINRHRMACVPQYPLGMGLMQAKLAGALRGEPLEHCNKVNHIRRKHNSRMFARVYPDRLFPTVITKFAVSDGLAGRVVHWNQNRLVTVMEAKRAQGFLDHEVLIGTAKDQLKIIGNSVDRKVALVLGLALRESWMSSTNALPRVDSTADALGVGDDEDMDIECTTKNVSMNRQVKEEQEATQEEIQVTSSADSSPIKAPTFDNRSVKMALMGLTEEDLGEIRIGGFKAINRIFAQKAAEGNPVKLISPSSVRAGGGISKQSFPSPRRGS